MTNLFVNDELMVCCGWHFLFTGELGKRISNEGGSMCGHVKLAYRGDHFTYILYVSIHTSEEWGRCGHSCKLFYVGDGEGWISVRPVGCIFSIRWTNYTSPSWNASKQWRVLAELMRTTLINSSCLYWVVGTLHREDGHVFVAENNAMLGKLQLRHTLIAIPLYSEGFPGAKGAFWRCGRDGCLFLWDLGI